MAENFVIDADLQLEEPDEAWDYLDEVYAHRKPRISTIDESEADAFTVRPNAFWLIDGMARTQIERLPQGRQPLCKRRGGGDAPTQAHRPHR